MDMDGYAEALAGKGPRLWAQERGRPPRVRTRAHMTAKNTLFDIAGDLLLSNSLCVRRALCVFVVDSR